MQSQPPIPDQQTLQTQLSQMLQPWEISLANPPTAQENILHRLLLQYAQTDYGQAHGAGQIDTLNNYRQAFPVAKYEDFKPFIEDVMKGELQKLLWEEPLGWAITRGTTKGESKFIPMTPTDMRLRASAGRAMLAYVAATERFDLLAGVNLNLNFPSVVGNLQMGERQLEYGYSSGIYTRYVAKTTPIRSVPTQEEIDALGGGKSIQDWNRRFKLAYDLCKDKNVTLVGGVCPTAIRFGRYLKQKHNCYPRDIWKTEILTLGSVPGINTYYQPVLNALYGQKASIREIYGTTEGMFGQQRDEKRAWTPNYDLFFFEVQTPSGIKMLHEMLPGETGGLVVSTPIFPRYRIGDLIRAFKPPYFRCIGREKRTTPFRYAWQEFSSLNFGRL